MKITAISDVHIKKPHDEADKLLTNFLLHPETQSADYIMLLGDIFDLMCGPHDAYVSGYAHIFKIMDDLQKKGKKVHFFEGNHDVHLVSLFEKIWPNKEIISSQEPLIEKIDGKTYYFSHGDEHEVDNLAYQRYMKFIHSKPLTFVANHIMPFQVLNLIGERASKISRKKGHKSFNSDGVRERFRKGVETTTAGQYDFVLGGHSHVQDTFKIPGSEEVYVNNGYAQKTKTFILIENHQVKFCSLS